MSLFDEIVNAAIREKPETSTLRPVVEKEILHHEILSILSREGLLKNLTFMGGTCLRDCYGSPRLSEDLDFSSVRDFSYDDFKDLGSLLTNRIQGKFGFSVKVGEPHRDEGDNRTWRIKVITRPESPHLPTQKIHIDICSLPSIERKPSLLINIYNIDMGTFGLVLQVEPLEEILADKFTAFALRPNRVKNRDIWDIIWLKQRGVRLNREWVYYKADQRSIGQAELANRMKIRFDSLRSGHDDFIFEIRRFLPAASVQDIFGKKDWWEAACLMIEDEWERG